MKKVIVLGGAGFIGINMLKLLFEKNYKIISIDNLGYANNIDDNIFKKIKNFKIDIKSKKLKKVFKQFKPDFILNFAAETHVDRSIDNAKKFIETNINGVFNILESIRTMPKIKKMKFIHISTDEVYGDIKKKNFSNENDRYNPSSPYAASKSAADLLIKSYVKTYNIPAIITNCCNNYGPYQFPEKFIPKSILSIINQKKISIYGNGKNEREWIYVEDHCNAIIKIMSKGVIGEQYNIGSGFIKNNIYVAKNILKILKKSKKNLIYIKDRPSHDKRYALDYSKLKKKIGYKNKFSFHDGLKKTIDWYLNSKWINKKKHFSFNKRLGLKV